MIAISRSFASILEAYLPPLRLLDLFELGFHLLKFVLFHRQQRCEELPRIS